jgi:AbrB family looped-hinge helix DNA binding protein
MARVATKSVLTKKSQLTLPKKIREFLQVKPGDMIDFRIEETSVTIMPIRSELEANFGKVNPKRKPENFSEIRNQIEDGIAQEVVKEFR